MEGEASVTYTFHRANTVILRANTIFSEEISNLEHVRRALEDAPDWNWDYYIVYLVRNADNCFFLGADQKDTKVTISGALDLVKSLKAGSATAGVSVQVDGSVGLKQVGYSGPIACNVVRLKPGAHAEPVYRLYKNRNLTEEDIAWLEEPADETDLA